METKAITPFAFDDHLVRVFEDEKGNPWFIAKDICKILEIEKYRDAVSRLDEDERESVIVDTLGGAQSMTTISESGLYALVFRSRKPEAKTFSKWVRSEVLPSIRKTGRYDFCGEKKRQPIASPSYNFPEELLALSLNLKPAMRQRLWRDSMDTARLDGGGFEAACECFKSLCQLMSGRRKFTDLASLVLQFMDECLEEVKGFNTPARKIYELFEAWWQENGIGCLPSQKALAGLLQSRFTSYKASVKIYRDCRIIHGVV